MSLDQNHQLHLLLRELATVVADMKNLINAFNQHVSSDEIYHKEIDDRIKLLEKNEARLHGKILGIGIATSAIVGFITKYGSMLLR